MTDIFNKTQKLATKNLCFFYGKNQSLFDINLSFLTHDVTAIIGPSGCGKSTYLRCLNRIYELHDDHHATGQIFLEGQNILSGGITTLDLRRRVGMIFQKPTPFAMSIFDNIAYGLKLHFKLSRAEVEALVQSALEKSALWHEVKDKLKKSALSLSGGQQQRLCIARTIALSPEVLLMDEPTSALDPKATAKIEELIVDLKQHYSIIIVTHNMQQAARISDHTAFFYEGRLIEEGKTSKIFTAPSKTETGDYITGRFG